MGAAKFAGTRKFQSTEREIVCGCTQMPSSGQKFCKEHLNSVPYIVVSVLPKTVKTQLIEGSKGPQLC